ncbi:class I SAM-dependent DNA methyltransferase [Streptomyces sp. HMX112]|uniref:class I SAM-dependent DNA methyltransferase n=1 Tax=Streptomyces sp. HMX112 TaxID=3390850 RepID=UPI003A7F8602
MKTSHDVIARSHQLDGTPDQLTAYYGSWATTYEQDVRNVDYQGPRIMADLFTSLQRDGTPTTALDAGCGTGLIGSQLAARAETTLDGLDLSHAMIAEAAKTGTYRLLTSGVDLNLGLREISAHTYDITLCCGVFTPGHVLPVAVEGLLRVTRPGGYVLLSTRKRYLGETNFVEHLNELCTAQRTEVLQRHVDQPYTADETADYWVLASR